MEPLDLTEFEWKIVVRPLTIDDYDALIAMSAAVFSGNGNLGPEQIESQLAIFPEGQLCVEIDGQLAASSSSLILEYDSTLEWHNWKAVADGGYIRNHKPKGDTLYGIEIMVHPEFRGMKLSRRLYDARKELCREKNLARIIIAGRIPGYHKHADKLTAREYIEQVVDKALVRSGADGATVQRIFGPRTDPQLLALRYRVVRLRDLSGMDQSGLCAGCQAAVPSRGRTDSRSASCSTRCVRSTGFDEFAQQCEFFLDTASDYKCDFVLFPELFTTQLLVLRGHHAARTGGSAGWRNSRRSTSSSLPRWRSSTTST